MNKAPGLFTIYSTVSFLRLSSRRESDGKYLKKQTNKYGNFDVYSNQCKNFAIFPIMFSIATCSRDSA